MRPETLNTEIYWHDFIVRNYSGNYTLSLEGWFGVLSNIEIFDSCSHTISCFCDAYVVFRHNMVSRADSHTDLHGPGYDSQGNWVINARAGQGHIITGNRFDSSEYQILLYWDSGASTHGNNYGTGDGQTCQRCHALGCEGCCQAQEKTYIWGNDGSVIEYTGGADDCLIQGETYFLREPNMNDDGFSWTPFTYPHPLRSIAAVGRTVQHTPSTSTHDR